MSSYTKLAIPVDGLEGKVSSRALHNRVPRRLWQSAFYKPLSYVLGSSGKRIRGEILEISFQIAGGEGELPSELVEFIELLHGGSLVIDDIEDQSDQRRGKPALHEVAGVPLAINTGNWLYFHALEQLCSLAASNTTKIEIMTQSLRTIRRCHEGQALDLAAKVTDMEREEIYPTALAISKLKTGGLTALAARLGSTVARSQFGITQASHCFGLRLGVALQMQNDLQELESSARPGGRDDDLRNGRVTWPWAWLSQIVPNMDFADLQQLHKDRLLDESHNGLTEVAGIMLNMGFDLFQEEIRKQIRHAIAVLEEHIDSCQLKRIRGLISRIGELDV